MTENTIQRIPDQVYRGIPALNQSVIKMGLKSPAHLYTAMTAPKREPTADMILGSAVHTLVLEPEKFPKDFAVAPKVDRRTKIGKDTWAKFLSDSEPGSTAIAEDQAAIAHNIAHAVIMHPVVKELLSNGEPERSIQWTDLDTEIKCKGRMDWVRASEGRFILDLKTTLDASPRGFMRECHKWGYHIQAAFYSDGMHAITDDLYDFLFVAVEKTPPYGVGVYRLPNEFIQEGQALYLRALQWVAEYKDSGQPWPNYSLDVETLEPQGWMYRVLQQTENGPAGGGSSPT